ncbi:hypothetical protein FACS1894200_04150 [Spirochaetia bacterium]|nr:hypothetical protein FACS1894200_04150 [Spirochaetia bacterium]
MRYRLAVSLGLVLLLGGVAFAQESILTSYQRNFVRANLTTKMGILRDAATDEHAPEFIGALYEFALSFVLRNADLLKNDPDMIALAGIACQGAGQAKYKRSVETLWRVFQFYQDSLTRVEVLNALSALGGGNTHLLGQLNQYLANQTSLYRSGVSVDIPTVTACIQTLASLGDASSFPVLFSAMTAEYPSAGEAAAQALQTINGDLKQFLLDVLKKNPPLDKLYAYRAGVHNEKFTDLEQAELAQTALEISLADYSGSQDNMNALRELRYLTIPVLTQYKWSRASPHVLQHYYKAQADFADRLVSQEHFLEAIRAVGAMGNSEAAQLLALQLGFFNSQTERNASVNAAVTLAVINALGEIGDKIAFDYLLYISYLSYPDEIQSAAKEALNQLKW